MKRPLPAVPAALSDGHHPPFLLQVPAPKFTELLWEQLLAPFFCFQVGGERCWCQRRVGSRAGQRLRCEPVRALPADCWRPWLAPLAEAG